MRNAFFVSVLFIVIMLCGCKSYEPAMTSETAIELVLTEGQRYFVEEFDEWQSWSVRKAEFQTINLETLLDKKYDGTKYIWHVVFQNDDGTRSVHFVVKDDNQKVLRGWDSTDAVVNYKEEPEDEYGYTAEDVIIRAILYEELQIERQRYKHDFENKHVYVYLDNYGAYDEERLRDLDGKRNGEFVIPVLEWTVFFGKKTTVPLGKQAWRVTFCNQKEHGNWCVDRRVIIGYDLRVYGYENTNW